MQGYPKCILHAACGLQSLSVRLVTYFFPNCGILFSFWYYIYLRHCNVDLLCSIQFGTLFEHNLGNIGVTGLRWKLTSGLWF